MNQHSKKSGQANGNSVYEMQRGATRPAVVVAIVLCVSFAFAVVGISSCRKPQSQQETQTQSEAAVQTEIPQSEAPQSEIPESEAAQTEIPGPDAVQIESPKPKSVSRVSAPDGGAPSQPSTAPPLSQDNPAARQSVDDHANSPAPVEDNQSYTFSHDLNSETVTFDAVNPTTKVKGLMTVTINGAYRGKRLGDGQSTDGSHLQADQQATFVFNPYDPYSPSYSATVKTLGVAGDTTNNSVFFDFGLEATGSDGSSQQFTLREVVTVTEDGAHVTFEQPK